MYRIFSCLDFHLNLTFSVLLNLTMENRTTQEMIVNLDGIPKILSKIAIGLTTHDSNIVIAGLRLIANILEIGEFS